MTYEYLYVVKVNLKNIKSTFDLGQEEVVLEFIKFLQSELPLKTDVVIEFTNERVHNMTTGLRKSPNIIYILSKDRLLVDILRTIAHEWAHEIQHQKLGLGEKEKVQKIGGPEEDFANIMAGILFKSYEKQFPHKKKIVYNED